MSFKPGLYNKRISLQEAGKKWGWPKPPLKSNFEILLGDGCNAACLFCCAYKEIGSWLPLESVKRDIRRERARGTQMITLSGGEPTIYPGIVEAVACARESGFTLIQIVSNGLRLSDPAFTGRLAEEKELQVSYSEVLPYVRYALEYMRQNRVGIDWKVLGNFLPCLLPEYANLMMDWGAASAADKKTSVRKKGGSFTSLEFMEKRKIKPASCRGCVCYSKCYGIDVRYCEKFGTDEFRPLKALPRSFPLRPVY